jgi:LmbE family N-acetylglucosaminyl deacetylase
VLDNHDGKLLPTLDVREQVIREIRQWKADIVIAPRPNDYHPDHRYTGVLVQDASYMVIVPNLVKDTMRRRREGSFRSLRSNRPGSTRSEIASRNNTLTSFFSTIENAPIVRSEITSFKNGPSCQMV